MKRTFREWLNAEEDGRASVIAWAGTDDDFDHTADSYFTIATAGLVITDCSRSIDLEFGVNLYSDTEVGEAQLELNDRLAKVRKLRQALDIIEDELKEGQLRLNKVKLFRRNKKKKKAD